jgi:hypothetical protein
MPTATAPHATVRRARVLRKAPGSIAPCRDRNASASGEWSSVHAARLVLAACAVLLVPSVSAAAELDGGARSGGAKALPVMPSNGGSSEALPDESAQLGGAPVVSQPPPALPPADGAPIAAEAAGADTETAPEPEVVVPLEEEENDTPVEPAASPARADPGESGSLPFTGAELAGLAAAGIGLLAAGLLIRGGRGLDTR